MSTPSHPTPRGLSVRAAPPSRTFIVPALLVLALLAACDRGGGGGGNSQPAPPPPSDKVPDAPGPDNTIKELDENAKPAEPSPAPSPQEPDKK